MRVIFPKLKTLVYVFCVITAVFFLTISRISTVVDSGHNDEFAQPQSRGIRGQSHAWPSVRIMTPEQRRSMSRGCRATYDFDCMKVVLGDTEESDIAKDWRTDPDDKIDPAFITKLRRLGGCPNLLRRLNFATAAVTRKEAENPLGFGFLIHSDFNGFIRVLRSVYRPQNAFAIHVDVKSNDTFRKGVVQLVECLPNAVMVEPSRDIRWGSPNILLTKIRCLEVLRELSISYNWIYAQFLTETDRPLKTIAEMVEIFEIFGGANDVELAADEQNRVQIKSLFVNFSEFIDFTEVKKPIIPGNMHPFKGRSAASLSRAFVEFILTNKIARDFLNWTLDTWIPAEKYWSTLNHNLHLDPPGGYPGFCLDYAHKPYISRFQTWEYDGNHDGLDQCNGEWVRWSCSFGVKDLPTLATKPHLVAHKFEPEIQPAAAYCLEEWLCRRAYGTDQLYGRMEVNRTYYEDLPAVRYHKMKDKSQFVCSD